MNLLKLITPIWKCTMPYWRDEGRLTVWTRDGRLVYVSQPKKDPIIWALNLTLKRLINHDGVDGFTNRELYHVCAALRLRKDKLIVEQNKER